MSIEKIIVAIVSSIFGGGLLFVLLRYFIINYFKNREKRQEKTQEHIEKLYSSRNKLKEDIGKNIAELKEDLGKHNVKFENHDLRINTLEKEIKEIKQTCKENYHKEG